VLQQWFNERLLWGDASATADLVKKGLVTRTYLPQVVIKGIMDADPENFGTGGGGGAGSGAAGGAVGRGRCGQQGIRKCFCSQCVAANSIHRLAQQFTWRTTAKHLVCRLTDVHTCGHALIT